MPFREFMVRICKSNKFRVIWFTVLQMGALVLTLITLAIATSNPKSALSWGKFKLDYEIDNDKITGQFNMGLLRYQVCFASDDSSCSYLDVGAISSPDNNFTNAGRGVITALTFSMLFGLLSVIALWLTVLGKGAWMRFPRIVLNILCFLALTLYIVALSTWYKLGNDRMATAYYGGNTAYSVMPGYAVAIIIVVIVMSFFAWFFAFWRLCRPNVGEPEMTFSLGNTSAAPQYNSQASSSALETGKAQVAETAVPPAYDEGANGNSGVYSNGAYGGSGGAYGNSSYGNNNSSYGGGGRDSGSAYGEGGSGYSNKRESAYGY